MVKSAGYVVRYCRWRKRFQIEPEPHQNVEQSVFDLV